MPVWNAIDFQQAQASQATAANDPARVVRLVAGPGTGKSFSIEQKVANLLQSGVTASSIYAVSYTRAAATDLKLRIEQFCNTSGLSITGGIRASTVHSLALRILRSAGILGAQYPVDPMVLDNWEVENIFDLEFNHITRFGKPRCAEIRSYWEAFWSTGNQSHPSYKPPASPITQQEQTQFTGFKNRRSNLYSCVLPGEIVQQVVQRAIAGTLNVQQVLNISHLIVDEFQDLNPMDLELMQILISAGVQLFASGDDDQSIYSFRYGSPEGIRNLPLQNQGVGQHMLGHCFRCTPSVLNPAVQLMATYSDPQRIPKTYISMYSNSAPSVLGSFHRWMFSTHRGEARAIADSCQNLINSGLNPKDILILISNKRIQLGVIEDELRQRNLNFDSPNNPGIQDTDEGRLIVALMRLICNNDDYISLRTIWGLRSGIGPTQTETLATWITNNQQNFKTIFFQNLPLTNLQQRTASSVQVLRGLVNTITGWAKTDTLGCRNADIIAILNTISGQAAVALWTSAVQGIDSNALLSEVRDFLWTESDEQKSQVLAAISDRLELEHTPNTLPDRIRIMTMHGSKGLSAKVVFIPGLEEQILPGPNRIVSPGLTQEAARLLYVAITRAKASCIVSLAQSRFVNGKRKTHAASQFTNALGGSFSTRSTALTSQEVNQIMSDISRL
ncbi:MAG: hypothetical protein COT74_02015 [Bdellovibrionales bacterium CG10_big_fil_rev_8_21_14_0_10_45_34]|nr:MAG: hypothetical protein COT74_02015 [Bdellovibrionales bacterium CG10_big_fil_rev_8_21_14_0_10_45_34]